jgi:cholesterol oxidase
VGCNYGSKNTLDYTYLTEADRLGVELRDRCEVREFGPRPGGGFWVTYVEHQPENEGHPTNTKQLPTKKIESDRLVLSAGTFGSTFLLLKNQRNFPGISEKLGHFFSGNGDFLGIIRNAHETIGTQQVTRVLEASRGSVITSTVRIPDTRDGGSGPGFYIQDGGYPGFVDWLVETSDVGSEIRRALRFVRQQIIARVTRSGESDLDHQIQALLGDAHRSSSILPLLGMGFDTPDGVMTLDDKELLALNWTARSSRVYFDRVNETMKLIASKLEAEFTDNPLWYLRKHLITVHPVGGCSMSHAPSDGVVDSYGEVYGYPGFVIADGSVIPGPVGPNPSFTIAALSDRFADHQLARRSVRP